MHRAISALLTLGSLASHAFAAVHEEWWNVTYVENMNPDGLFPRRVVGVNGSWPYVLILPFLQWFISDIFLTDLPSLES